MAQNPTYVYKILPSSAAPPDPLPDCLPVSDLDMQSGFIHLSSAKQVPTTLNLFFSQDEKVYILRIRYADIRDQVKWENAKGDEGKAGDEGVFPHLYNGNQLGTNEIDSITLCDKFQAEQNEAWGEALSTLVSNKWLS